MDNMSNDVAVKTPQGCVCGCGGTTKGGSFIPGHDARHKSNLIKRIIQAASNALGQADAAEAMAELEQRNWVRFLDKARETAAKAQRATSNRRVGLPSAAEVIDWDGEAIPTEETIGDLIIGNTIRIERTYKGRNLGDEDIAVGKIRLVAEGEVDFYVLTAYDSKTKRPILGALRTVRMTDIKAILKQDFKAEAEGGDDEA